MRMFVNRLCFTRRGDLRVLKQRYFSIGNIGSTRMANITQRSDSADISGLEDIEPPFDTFLRGKYKKSFAYTTIKDRLPIILTKVVDGLSRSKDDISKIYGTQAVEEIKQVVGGISKLKNELVTNKAITPLIVMPHRDNDDAKLWNDKVEQLTKEEQETQLWYNTKWLICECYMYRRIAQEFLITKHLQTYDPFAAQKEESFFKSEGSFSHLSEHIMHLVNTKNNKAEQEKIVTNLIKLNLWGNKCDLSLSAGHVSSQDHNPLDLLESLNNDILVDNSNQVWKLISNNMQHRNNSSIIDIVLDNSGYELFTDLCLAAFLMENKFADKMRFYVKRYPWFISDVMKNDFYWLIEAMTKSDDQNIKSFGQLCDKYLKDKSWTIEEELFWTDPFDFSEMKSTNPTLYDKLSQAFLVIFKGDLNYRKLLGDVNWKYTTDFTKSLRGFQPTNVLSLRTMKADLCSGLPAGMAEKLKKDDPNWMNIGKYGLIQTSFKM